MDLLGRQKLVDSMQASVLQAGEARVMASYPIQENNLAGGFPFREDECTFEDFLQEIEDGRKADLLDGVIYMASPDNTDAADLSTWLTVVFGGYVGARDLGKIFHSRVAYRIGPKRGPEPDIGFVSKELEATRRRGYIDGPPRMAIEIVSPDSVARDYVQKRAVYEQAGVGEYWILDPDEGRVTFLVLQNGRFEQVFPKENIIHCTVVPGFYLDVRWLLSQERPAAYQVLQQLLGNA